MRKLRMTFWGQHVTLIAPDSAAFPNCIYCRYISFLLFVEMRLKSLEGCSPPWSLVAWHCLEVVLGGSLLSAGRGGQNEVIKCHLFAANFLCKTSIFRDLFPLFLRLSTHPLLARQVEFLGPRGVLSLLPSGAKLRNLFPGSDRYFWGGRM